MPSIIIARIASRSSRDNLEVTAPGTTVTLELFSGAGIGEEMFWEEMFWEEGMFWKGLFWEEGMGVLGLMETMIMPREVNLVGVVECSKAAGLGEVAMFWEGFWVP